MNVATVALDVDELRTRLSSADGDEAMRDLFAQLEAAVGRDEASRLWWAAFAASDASDT